jgi:peptidase C25-like protein/flagellar hook capping protein FlgD
VIRAAPVVVASFAAVIGLSASAWALPPRPARQAPDAGRAAPFAPSLLPSTSGSPVDCVIVAPDSMADIYQRLADYQTRTGRATVVRGLSTIRALDPRSNDLAQAVRSFLRSAYELWGIRWAILAGDHEAIPLRVVRVLSPSPEDIPSDAYYADLDGTWDGNGNGVYGEVADSLDMVSDIAVGRLSANTRAEATIMVNRALRYATGVSTASVGQNLLLAEVLFPSDWQPGQFISSDGAQQAQMLLPRTPGCVASDRYYENYTAYPGSLSFTKSNAMSAIGQGYHVVAHYGHGSRSQLSFGNAIITAPELASIPTGESTALWIANNCASAAVDFDCVAERMVRSPTGGTLAYVGATRDAWPENTAPIANAIFDRLFGSSPIPLGDAIEGARATMLPSGRSETLARWGYFETILLGVPSLDIWKCPPVPLTVTRPSSVPIGAGGFGVTVQKSGAPVESALVVAWKAGEDYRAVYTNASGQATVPFHPASTGSFSLAVTSRGCVPSLDSLTVSASAPALYVFLGAAARDDLGGDADGTVGAGEQFGIGGSIRNAGGSAGAGTLQVTMQALTAGVAINVASGVAPSLAAGAQTAIPSTLRAHALATPLSERSERLRIIVGDGVRSDTTQIALAVGAPAPLLAANVFSDAGAGGNGNGVLDPGETASLAYTVGNDGGARARSVTVQVLNPASGVTLIDTNATLGDVAAGATATTPALRFSVTAVPSGRLYDLKLQDTYGHSWTFPIERSAPGQPAAPNVEASSINRITIGWSPVAATDLLGYRVYRGPNDASTPQPLMSIPLRRIPSYEDAGLLTLTSYRYQVSAVDSSGNEGPRSPILLASTTPPSLTGWPVPMGQSTSSSVCLADLDGDHRPEVIVGAEYLYVLRPDGTDWLDGDQNAITTGIFSTALHYIPSSPTAADLDFDGTPEIIAASWDDSTVGVWKSNGTMMPGWPRKGAAPFWSVPAVGEIDGDQGMEIVVGSNSSRLYAWNSDGTEVLDGDQNPSTQGVYYVPLGTTISSPAIADIDKDGVREVVFGTSAGRVYALRYGVPLAGWPFVATGLMSSSPAIGDIVPGGGLEIAMASSNDSVYVLTSSGTRAPGWPRPLELTTGNGRTPSPALAPLRKHLGDPSLCVIICGADGKLTAFDPAGNTLPGWGSVQLGANAATEASPAVADIDGDGALEVLIAAEDRRLYAFRFDGTPVSGFPIETGAELRGTPAVWDLDGDGACDIIVAGWDRNIYAWRYPGTFNQSGMAWPMFHHDNWRTGLATFPILTAVDTEPAAAAPPARPSLAQNRPNPFNPVTVIGYSVAAAGPEEVRLRVFTIAGRLVRTLVSRRVEPGYHEARWDGRDDHGLPAASGVYLYRADIGRTALTRKMTLLR